MANGKNSKQNPMTEKNTGLSSAQEVTYQSDFKKANKFFEDKKGH